MAIADGITKLIEKATLGVNPIIARSYAEWDLQLSNANDLELTDSSELHIDVVIHTTEQELEIVSRGKVQFGIPIDIAVRQKLSSTEQDASTGVLNKEEVDRLVKVTQDLSVMFAGQRLATFDCATWDAEKGTKIVVCPMRQHLRELRQFTGIVRVHFLASLTIPIAE